LNRVRACSVEETCLHQWHQELAKLKVLQQRVDAVLALQRSKGKLDAQQLRLQRMQAKQEEERRVSEARAARGKCLRGELLDAVRQVSARLPLGCAPVIDSSEVPAMATAEVLSYWIFVCER
jgi:hypothetical protein